VLVWQAPTQAMNPKVPAIFIANAYAEDEASAAAEYGAEFRRDLEAFVSGRPMGADPLGIRGGLGGISLRRQAEARAS
jgi:hypothetical protein